MIFLITAVEICIIFTLNFRSWNLCRFWWFSCIISHVYSFNIWKSTFFSCKMHSDSIFKLTKFNRISQWVNFWIIFIIDNIIFQYNWPFCPMNIYRNTGIFHRFCKVIPHKIYIIPCRFWAIIIMVIFITTIKPAIIISSCSISAVFPIVCIPYFNSKIKPICRWIFSFIRKCITNIEITT